MLSLRCILPDYPKERRRRENDAKIAMREKGELLFFAGIERIIIACFLFFF